MAQDTNNTHDNTVMYAEGQTSNLFFISETIVALSFVASYNIFT